jgi:Bacterial CdiA-CT RNAse A domain
MVRSTRAICVVGLLILMGGCGTTPEPGLPEIRRSEIPKSARGTADSAHYDLERDEARGGHTLEKHVARTDEELRERLARERNISAASTWANREVAEETVAEALRHEQNKIERWESRGDRRTNLALHYDAGRVIGRSMRHEDAVSSPCTDAVIVLKADGANGFYVLTTYPEERQ